MDCIELELYVATGKYLNNIFTSTMQTFFIRMFSL